MKRAWRGFGILTCVVLMAASSTFAAEEGWLVDLKAAKEKAAAEGKDLFMEFTGSDWCPPCISFKKKVLDTDVFKTGAPESYVLLKLDNPRDKSKQTPEEIEQYKKLSAEFKITGVPTVILADAQGKPFVKMVGYGGQEPDVYVKELVAKQDVRKTRDTQLAKAEKAEGSAKAKLLDQAISGIDSELAMSQYRDLIDQIVTLDGDNSAGLKAKYEGVLNLVNIRAALQEIVKSAGAGGVDDAAKKLDELIAEKNLAGEGLQEALFLKAQMLFRSDKAKSKVTLITAQKAAPETKIATQIEGILKQFFPDEDKTETKDDTKSEDKPAAAKAEKTDKSEKK